MMRRAVLLILVVCALVPIVGVGRPTSVAAQEPAIDARIRGEEQAHSEVMRTLHFLTDVYGPRLTGTPSLKAAGEWSIRTMESWGLTNAHLEPWDFGHPGWTNERLSAHLVAPVKSQLACEVLAWTPGTDGPVRA